MLLQIFYNINKYILNPIIALGFSVAVVILLWGGVMSIVAQQNGDIEEARRWREHLMYGLGGMFVMASVFGILELVTSLIRSVGV